ncbi:hypothetical protein ACFOWE_31325 [Planomonospora corallina]|uniref:Uncharacterized protein n=1 Tax=Planomonospora corallina TaxID=1806052 RepID=A0ABV8ILV7_9ACTN
MADQQRVHRCLAAGCRATIPVQLFMCRNDWKRLPLGLRSELRSAYRRRNEDWAAYAAARETAKQAVARTPRPV